MIGVSYLFFLFLLSLYTSYVCHVHSSKHAVARLSLASRSPASQRLEFRDKFPGKSEDLFSCATGLRLLHRLYRPVRAPLFAFHLSDCTSIKGMNFVSGRVTESMMFIFLTCCHVASDLIIMCSMCALLRAVFYRLIKYFNM